MTTQADDELTALQARSTTLEADLAEVAGLAEGHGARIAEQGADIAELLYASTDSDARLRVVEDELTTNLLGAPGSRVDTIEDAVASLSGRVDIVDDEVRGTGDTMTGSRLDLIEDSTTSTGLDARITELETAGYVTFQQLSEWPFVSQQAFEQLSGLVLGLDQRFPSEVDCGDGDVLRYDSANDWFECAPSSSVGRVLGVTTHRSDATRDLSGVSQAEVELERFPVQKHSTTSSLIVHGSLSVSGAGGPATITWQYGTGMELEAQLANGSDGAGTSLSTTAVLPADGQAGNADVVLRTQSQGAPPALPFRLYNPDDRFFWSTTTRIPRQRQLEFPTSWVSDLVFQKPSSVRNVDVTRSPAGRSLVPDGLARTRRGQGRLE